MANLVKSYYLSTGEIKGELIVQGRYSIQKLLTNTVTRYYKTVEFNDDSISQYLIKTVPSNINSIYLYCTGFVRKYKLPTVSTDYDEYLTIYIADDQSTYYLFQMECVEQSVYNSYTPPEEYIGNVLGEVTGIEEDELCQFILKHVNNAGGSANDGSSLTIPDQFFFDTEEERDTYFDLHPEDLSRNPLYVVVGEDLQKYNATEELWESITPTLMGPKGEPGLAATIAVGTTTTVEPGTSAEVINTGTDINAVFNFKIPKGEKGDEGDAADINPKGIYSSVETYNKYDTVIASDGNTYMCKIDGTTGVNPVLGTINWGLFTNRGETGLPGPAGPKGDDGITPSIDPTSKHWMIGSTDTQVVAEGKSSQWLSTEVELSNPSTIIFKSALSSDTPSLHDFVLSSHPRSYNWYGEITSVSTTNVLVTYRGKLNGLGVSIPNFESGHAYKRNEAVQYNGMLYIAKDDFISSGDPQNPSSSDFDETDWIELKVKPAAIFDDFRSGYTYSYHEGIVVGKNIYRSKSGLLTQSQWSLNGTITYWLLVAQAENWVPNYVYEDGDVIIDPDDNTKMLICDIPHTAESTWNETEAEYWSEQTDYPKWTANTQYNLSDYVEYNLAIYNCITPNSLSSFETTGSGQVWQWIASMPYHQTTIDLTSQIDGTKTVFSLGRTIEFPADTRLLLNGQEYDYLTHYTISGQNLTIKSTIPTPTPTTTDRMVVKFWE